ncbi:MAG: YkvA family protein [Actinomycetota bacterium]|nr:YkvA family protein [Actinomycetota bacterium]
MREDGTGVSIDLFPWGVLLIGLAAYAVIAAALIAAGRRDDARAIAGFVPDCVVMVSRLARDRRISHARRAVLFGVLAYLALPIDLIPDFLPIAGQLDDAVVLALALRLLMGGAETEQLRAAWPGPEASLRLVLRAAGREVNGAGSSAARARL